MIAKQLAFTALWQSQRDHEGEIPASKGSLATQLLRRSAATQGNHGERPGWADAAAPASQGRAALGPWRETGALEHPDVSLHIYYQLPQGATSPPLVHGLISCSLALTPSCLLCGQGRRGPTATTGFWRFSPKTRAWCRGHHRSHPNAFVAWVLLSPGTASLAPTGREAAPASKCM